MSILAGQSLVKGDDNRHAQDLASFVGAEGGQAQYFGILTGKVHLAQSPRPALEVSGAFEDTDPPEKGLDCKGSAVVLFTSKNVDYLLCNKQFALTSGSFLQ